METLSIVLAVLILQSAAAFDWKVLRTTWKPQAQDPSRLSSLFPIPRTLEETKSANWVEVESASSPNVTTWCLENDPRYCVLLDANGFVAGFQVGLLVEDLQYMQSVHDLSRLGTYRIRKMFDKDVWTTRVFTKNPDIINAGGRSDWDGLTGTEGIWFERRDGFMAVPKNLSNLDPIWLKQSCVNEMGYHHYYNMSTGASCGDFYPWLLLSTGEELIGCQFVEFGNISLHERDWYETITKRGIMYGIPDAPQCLIDWPDRYGSKSIHVYFIEESTSVVC